ncbi:glycosyltransferase family 39 protein [Candidatus Gottesmanbacteria bacterium]|nr:glycosyltransferase family 39 protein [Candidatus Gottesmanbacteria bacterium]
MSKNFLPPFFLGIIAVLILVYQINKPFVGHHDFNNVFYGNMARNLLRYPLSETKLGQVTNSGWVQNSHEFVYHTHHPPLLVWLLAVSYKLFGIFEVSTRLVPVVFSVLTVVFFYFLVRRLSNGKVALATAVFWLTTPLFIYFGKMAVQEVLVLFFFVFSFWVYFFAPKLLLPALFLAALSGWPGYYVSFIIWLYDRKKTIVLAVPFLAFGLHLFQNWLLTGLALGGGLASAFTLRSGSVALLPYLQKEASWILAYFTKPLVILSVVGLLVLPKHSVTPFLIFGLTHLIFFRQAVERHDYLIYYLLPFITLSAAWFLERILKNNKLFFLAVIIIAAASFWSGRFFSQALLASDYAKDGYTVGRLINKVTGPKETVLVIDDKIYNNFDWQVVFYGDRKVTILPQPATKITSNWIVKRETDGSFGMAEINL